MTAGPLSAQSSSISAWDAADFRVWSYVPYWTPQSQLNAFPGDGVYDHVSDVIYFGGVRPTSNGDLNWHPNGAAHLNTLAAHAAANDFRLHMSMFDVVGGSVDDVWTTMTGNTSYRANFVSNVTNLLQTYNMSGFNLDWERPNTVTKWGNYTLLAKEFRDVIAPMGMEVSVADFGSTDSRWDDSPHFDARVYDQLFIMGYHYPAFSSDWLNNNNFANGKLALTGQGPEKAFVDEQIVLGIGTWGTGGPATVTYKAIVDAYPNIPPDAESFTGTVPGLSGAMLTGTWQIESRYMVRDKVKLALDRNMAGMMNWTLHYDATNKYSLHRVAHHHIVFHRNIPDLNLDGRVDATDAEILADNMGTVPGWTGTNTPARFDKFYLQGNWEVGDHNGNGFVNQQDANWLAQRFNDLGVTLPDRLPYTGTFEKMQNSVGLQGRWHVLANHLGQLPETGNYAQQDAGALTFAGTGPGASKYSNTSVVIRNQNAAEAFDSLNTAPREMRAELTQPLDLGENSETFVTFLVRQNTGPLLGSQQSSPNRTLSLEFLNSAGASQFDFSFHGQQTEFSINSHDVGGESVAAGGFNTNATYLFVGKITADGVGANVIEASLFAEGDHVGNFTDPNFDWALSGSSGLGFNPVITDVQFKSLYQANYTVSNLWIGGAADFFDPPMPGDFNADGIVDAEDLALWQAGFGMTDSATHWHGDANGDGKVDGMDFLTWQRQFGTIASAVTAVPEPDGVAMCLLAIAGFVMRRGT